MFEPKRSHQRYCQHRHCLRLVRRWQAAKRQQRRRARIEPRRAHAAAEKKRRLKRRTQAALQAASHTAQPVIGPRVVTQKKKSSPPFCDRPGCWKHTHCVGGNGCHYCGPDCRHTMRRVLDRERKARRRNTFHGQFKRRLEYDHAWSSPAPPSG
jgi:hypothetical protein